MTGQLLNIFFYRLALVVLTVVINCQLSHASSEGSFYSGIKTFGDLLLPKVSQVTVGSGVHYGPDYLGSDDYAIQPKFVFYMKFKNFLTLENEGLSVNILRLKNFHFGPIVHFTGPRHESSNNILAGLGSIKGSLDLGAYAKVTIADRFTGSIHFFHDLFGGKNGSRIDFAVSTLLYKEGNLSTALSADINWASNKRARRFFGISSAQSQASGLAEHAIGSSFQDTNIALATSWKFSEKWSLNGYTRYTRMLGSIAGSPLVKTYGSANQYSIGAFVTYTFGID